MDARDAFSQDPVASVRGIGKEWEFPCRHDPPQVRSRLNRDGAKRRQPSSPEQKAPPKTTRAGTANEVAEGFEIII